MLTTSLRAGLATLLFMATSPLPARAQTSVQPDTAPPAAAPADVQSLDAIMRAVYDVISGPAGPRNWDRFYSLFVPGARLVPTLHDSTGHIRLDVISPRGYVKMAGQLFLQEGFYEREIGRETNTFGAMTQLFSAYDSRSAPDEKPFARGINSFQLFNDGTRWYIVTIYWNEEDPKHPIPDRYLHVQR